MSHWAARQAMSVVPHPFNMSGHGIISAHESSGGFSGMSAVMPSASASASAGLSTIIKYAPYIGERISTYLQTPEGFSWGRSAQFGAHSELRKLDYSTQLNWSQLKNRVPTRMNPFKDKIDSHISSLYSGISQWASWPSNERRQGANRGNSELRTRYADEITNEEINIMQSYEAEPNESRVALAFLRQITDPTVLAQLARMLPDTTNTMKGLLSKASNRQIHASAVYDLISMLERQLGQLAINYRTVSDALNDSSIGTLEKQPVYVIANDLSFGLVSKYEDRLPPHRKTGVSGVWHIAICAFGRMYDVSGTSTTTKDIGDVYSYIARQEAESDEFARNNNSHQIFHSHRYRSSPHVTRACFEKYVAVLTAQRFPSVSAYDMIENNCIDFAREALWFLSRDELPSPFNDLIALLGRGRTLRQCAIYVSTLLDANYISQFLKVGHQILKSALNFITDWLKYALASVDYAVRNYVIDPITHNDLLLTAGETISSASASVFNRVAATASRIASSPAVSTVLLSMSALSTSSKDGITYATGQAFDASSLALRRVTRRRDSAAASEPADQQQRPRQPPAYSSSSSSSSAPPPYTSAPRGS